MLNDQEKKLIKMYCLFPVAAKAFLAMALLIGGVWLVLVMIDNMVFNGGFYGLGIYTYIGIAAVYVIAFSVCILIPRIGMKKEKWQQIISKAGIVMSNEDYSSQMAAVFGAKAAANLMDRSDNANVNKAGDALDALAAVGSLVTVTQMTNEIARNAKLTANVCGVKIPKAGKYVFFIIFFPVLLLIAVYIPQFISSKQDSDRHIAVSSRAVYALQSSLQQDCDHVYIDDPKENYSDSGYRVTGYLYGSDEPLNSYISVTIGNDGLINDVRYSVDVDIQASKEENLEKAELDVLKLNVMMNDSGVKATSYDLLEEYMLPEEFKSGFNDVSYYEDLTYQKNDTVFVGYMTDSKEEYDEYSESYISFHIAEKN